ncbi:MAG: thiamine diphosphokinase [Anaerovoracaceae bacterium]
MIKQCVIFTSYFEGDINQFELINQIRNNPENYFIIAADGGYDILTSVNIVPNLIVGDLDSNSIEIPKEISSFIVKAEKDETDLDLAINKSIENSYEDIIIVGGIGGRLDHTLGNIQTIVGYTIKGLNISMMDSNQEMYILKNSSLSLKKKNEYKFSLLSHSPISKGVSITGSKYNLNNYDLTSTFPLAVSNEFIEDTVTITVKEGILIVILTSL